MATPEQIERVAAAMVAVRPGWSEASLVTYLTRHHAARPWRDLLVAGVIVAADERTQTPALMGQHGPWWLAAQAATGQATQDGQLGPQDARCARPGHEHELAHNCRACRSEALAATDQMQVRHVVEHVIPALAESARRTTEHAERDAAGPVIDA